MKFEQQPPTTPEVGKKESAWSLVEDGMRRDLHKILPDEELFNAEKGSDETDDEFAKRKQLVEKIWIKLRNDKTKHTKGVSPVLYLKVLVKQMKIEEKEPMRRRPETEWPLKVEIMRNDLHKILPDENLFKEERGEGESTEAFKQRLKLVERIWAEFRNDRDKNKKRRNDVATLKVIIGAIRGE